MKNEDQSENKTEINILIFFKRQRLRTFENEIPSSKKTGATKNLFVAKFRFEAFWLV